MKLEKNSNGILYKNKIQTNYKNMFNSKINEIESIINDENLEEKQKALEIQKKNAYYKLEKLNKELQTIENYIGNENDDIESVDLNEEDIYKNKINDIRQKNINIQEQIKMMRDYYNNFLMKYKNKQIEEKKELKEECDKIKLDIFNHKCYTKMTNDEKTILEKEEEIKKLDKQLERILKKIEDEKTKRYISNIRLKGLQNNIKKKYQNKEKKKQELIKKRTNYSENKKTDYDILTNIKNNQNANINNINQNRNINRVSQEPKIESTINIINRELPFSISALDNIINGQNSYELNEPKKLISRTENVKPKNVNSNKKKKSELNIQTKKNINRINYSSENKINLNENKNNYNNINTNNNNYKKQSNKYRNFNIKKSNLEEKNKISNIISIEKEEKPKNNINDNSPLGWLEDNAKIERKRDDQFNNENKNNDLFGNFENKKEDIKVDNNEEINKKDNIFNDRNLEISGIQGNFNRRRPFQSIKF